MTRRLVVSFPPDNGGLSRDEVDQILAAMDDDKLQQGRITTKDGKNLNAGIRSGRVQWITHKEVDESIFSHLYTLACVANRERDWNFEVQGIARAIQAVRYWGDREEHYDWHTDWGGGNSRNRKITVVAHLSEQDEFTGGLLQVTNSSNPLAAVQSAGTVTVFPTFLLHRVTPVTSGCRSAGVCWVLGPSFR
jgi:PKHD-type hydroxylase